MQCHSLFGCRREFSTYGSANACSRCPWLRRLTVDFQAILAGTGTQRDAYGICRRAHWHERRTATSGSHAHNARSPVYDLAGR
ncbi:hypothetical protein DSL92_04140 [Billgrantia gudaonensis]|uniref:Uncharacterized protein n=1 Tax=Billgrantia gudaonensis TaxID=376427 RepID=A0A3S0NE91_9GAMM|nr:hypothetical protein DSL92_04140 [Halomonas gudaonensis]